MLYEESNRLTDCFPRASNGIILLTTRNKKVGIKFTESERSLIHVESLTIEESVRFLKAKIDSESDEEDYAHLVTALENVPLAFVQAAALILMQSISISEYLHLYNHSDAAKLQLLADDFEDSSRDKNSQNAIERTLIISFGHISKFDPYAAHILSFMSMLDPQAIPKSLLSCDENPVILTRALGTLQAFSLIHKSSQRAQEDEYYDLHRLIRLVMFEYLKTNNEFIRSMKEATSIMLKRFTGYKDSFTKREICRTYFPHAAIILSSLEILNNSVSSQVAESSSTAEMEVESDLLYLLADYLKATGEYQLGCSMIQRSLAIRDQVLGPYHEKTLYCAARSVWFLGALRKDKEAIQLGRMTLSRAEKALGQEHPCTIDLMSELGFILSQHKMHQEAEQVLKRAFQLARTKFGEDDAVTLNAMGSRSKNLMDQGKHEEAEQIMRKSLQAHKKVHGEKNPNTLVLMSFLADCLSVQGKHEMAEEMARSTLQVQSAVLGEDHHDTLAIRSYLTLYLNKQKKYDEAEQISRQVLQLQKKILGPDHLHTLWTMSTLASCIANQNKYEEAERMAEQTLQLQKKNLGPEHPDRTHNTNVLIWILNRQGKHAEARVMESQLQDKNLN